jgi:hypothetical protein
MKHFAKLAACFTAAMCTVLASAQVPSTDGAAAPPTTTTSAYVYVLTQNSNNTYEIDGYSAASNGALTLIPGSPFWTSNSLYTSGLASTSHWVFVSDGTYIYSLSISSTGTLKQVSSVNAAEHYGYPGTAGASLVLDHTGSTLYAYALDGTGDNEFQFFSKNSTTGALTYLGSTGINEGYSGYLSFIGNNKDAYGFGCFQDSWLDDGYSRNSDGTLTPFEPTMTTPTYPNGQYCADISAADPASDLAVALYPSTGEGAPAPPAALAVYTVNSSGTSLTTNSTYESMPTSEVGQIYAMTANPTGNLLAVGGESGLQIFFFNGSKQITPYTGFLAEHPIWQLGWDNNNHLYGISYSGRLYSFTVKTTGYVQDPGSPYTVSTPRGITVVSK